MADPESRQDRVPWDDPDPRGDTDIGPDIGSDIGDDPALRDDFDPLDAREGAGALLWTVAAATLFWGAIAVAVLLFVACAAAPTDPLVRAHAGEDPAGWEAEPAGTAWTAARRDCVGFALRYRARLLAEGIAASDMVVMAVRAEGQDHAVLLVRRPDGLWVLDHLRDAPERWQAPSETGWFPTLAPDHREIPAWAPAPWRRGGFTSARWPGQARP